MNEFEYLYDDEFFIISSDNLDNIKSKLYGFVISDECIYYNNPPLDKLDGNGHYVYIFRENSKISIYQDFCGSYGLFIYNNDDYFAISNSFFKLVDFLKEKVTLNLNLDYAHTFIAARPCSNIYKETLIKEIQLLPQNNIVNIDVNNYNLDYVEIDYGEKTIPINSKECLEVLDKWYYKWVNLFNLLYTNTDNLEFSLSGGVDSRVVLALILSSKIDLNKINISTYISKKPSFIEDFEIASEIASDFGFKLNNNILNIKKYYFNDISTSINISYYLRGGFAKQMYWKNYIFSEKKYHIRGLGGELIKDFFSEQSTDAYILNQSDWAQNYSNEIFQSTKRSLKKTFENYSKIHETYNDSELLNIQYYHTRNRHYSCTQITENYFINDIVLCPLMDPLLNKIRIITGDENFKFLLPSLIILRYYPKLLDYKFEGNRIISEDTIVLANKINDLSPFINNRIESSEVNFDLKNKFDCTLLSENEKINSYDCYNSLKSIFDSTKFKKLFSTFFSIHLYEKIYKEENKLFPDAPSSDLNAIMVIMKTIEDVIYSQLNQNKTPYKMLDTINNLPINTFNEIKYKLKNDDARFDFKNIGEKSNDILILDISDDYARVHKPKWFTNSEGIGVTVETNNREIDIKLKCINDGNLEVKLKSRDVWDEENNRIYVAYKKAIMNSETILNKIQLASHDDSITFERKVVDGDIFDIHIEWENVN